MKLLIVLMLFPFVLLKAQQQPIEHFFIKYSLIPNSNLKSVKAEFYLKDTLIIDSLSHVNISIATNDTIIDIADSIFVLTSANRVFQEGSFIKLSIELGDYLPAKHYFKARLKNNSGVYYPYKNWRKL